MIKATATIERGKKANRVKRVKRIKTKPIGIASPGTARVRYKADPIVRGLQATAVCISIPIEELIAADRMAEQQLVSRSHLIRQALKLLAKYIASGGAQGEQWKAVINR